MVSKGSRSKIVQHKVNQKQKVNQNLLKRNEGQVEVDSEVIVSSVVKKGIDLLNV